MSTPAKEAKPTGLAALKNRRKDATPRRPSALSEPPVEELPSLPDAHPTMVQAVQRRTPLLLDPRQREQLHVVEIGGHVPSALLEQDYVVSPFDAHEQLTPLGCTTPIMRSLWTAGQHVRRDVFATYLALHPELVATDETEADESTPQVDSVDATPCEHESVQVGCETCQVAATPPAETNERGGAPDVAPPTAV